MFFLLHFPMGWKDKKDIGELKSPPNTFSKALQNCHASTNDFIGLSNHGRDVQLTHFSSVRYHHMLKSNKWSFPWRDIGQYSMGKFLKFRHIKSIKSTLIKSVNTSCKALDYIEQAAKKYANHFCHDGSLGTK